MGRWIEGHIMVGTKFVISMTPPYFDAYRIFQGKVTLGIHMSTLFITTGVVESQRGRFLKAEEPCIYVQVAHL